MEQHPVPQNVTTFQFRLIGDMTLRQFGYLAGGIIIAYICYKLPLPFFFTWPLTVLSAVGGFGLAFVPIEERPMDIWIRSFIKNVYSPTQYVWQKTKPMTTPTVSPPVQKVVAPEVKPAPVAIPEPAAPAIVKAAPTPAQNIPEQTRQKSSIHMSLPSFSFLTAFTTSLQDMFKTFTAKTPKTEPAVPAPMPNFPAFQRAPQATLKDIFANIKTPSVTGKRFEVGTQTLDANKTTEQARIIQDSRQDEATAKINKLESSLTQLQQELSNKTVDQSHIVELQAKLAQVLADREAMEKELVSLRQHMNKPTTTPQVTRPAGVVAPPPSSQPSVRVIAAEGAVHAGLPRLTTFPNVATGIIKDATGSLLTGILVTVRDKDDVPLRALKSNKLGQFAASTPLPNGTYIVDIEDPRGNYTFDRVQITLTGSLVPAIEVTAKSQKQIARDKLAHEIFGDTKL